jgi:hypothetical protein
MINRSLRTLPGSGSTANPTGACDRVYTTSRVCLPMQNRPQGRAIDSRRQRFKGKLEFVGLTVSMV